MSYKILVRGDTSDVSVTLSNIRALGTASANPFPPEDDVWWVSRVLVQKAHRGRGIGKFLVANLVNAVRKMGAKKLMVCPGGYDISYEDQVRFYESCGFKKESDHSGKEGAYYLDLETEGTPNEVPDRCKVFLFKEMQEEDIHDHVLPSLDIRERGTETLLS
jgi:GNAT superfamily N-acetyltransferase